MVRTLCTYKDKDRISTLIWWSKMSEAEEERITAIKRHLEGESTGASTHPNHGSWNGGSDTKALLHTKWVTVFSVHRVEWGLAAPKPPHHECPHPDGGRAWARRFKYCT
jgi:hypothetical protein